MLILGDPRIAAVTPANLKLIFTQEYFYNWSVTGAYRPLTTLSFLFNYAVLGNRDRPAGYHWVNFGLHAVNIALVYLLALVLLKKIPHAFAIAALWALHPLSTEAVTNIVGRGDLLAAMAVLAALLCHTKAATASGRARLLWLGALALAAAVGLFSKESALVVIALMILYDLTFRPRLSWRALAPAYLALAPPFVAFWCARALVLAHLPTAYVSFVDNPLIAAGFWTARLTAVKVIGKYLWLLFFPLHLSCDYSYNQIPLLSWRFHNAEDWKVIASLAACVALAAIALVCYRRNKPVFFFIALFFAALVPTSNLLLIIPTIMGDRLMYLPSIGFAAVLVVAVFAALPRPRMAAPVVLALVCLVFAARTFIRNFDWLNEESLWRSAVQVCPASFKTHLSLAYAMGDPQNSRLDRTIAELDRALAILDPLPDADNLAAAYMNAGMYYRRKGDLLAPNPAGDSWYRKSLDLLLRGERIEAAREREYRRRDLLRGRIRPNLGWYQLYLELGRTYMRLAQPRQALAAFEQGRKLRATPEFVGEIAAAHRAAGDLPQAAITLFEGLLVDTGQTSYAAGIVELYQQMDPQGCAILTAGNERKLNLNCPLVHGHICAAAQNIIRRYLAANQPDEAARIRASALGTLACR